MAYIERTELEIALERQEKIEEQEILQESQKRRLKHEYDLAKLKHATQPRYKAVERVLVAFAKAPVWFVLAISLPILVAKGGEIPESLNKFMTL